MAGTSEPGNPFLGWLAKIVDENWSSRRVFCEQAGINDGAFSKILSGKSDPEPPTLRRIADALLAKGLIKNRAELATRALFPDEEDVDVHERGHKSKGRDDEIFARYKRAVRDLTPGEQDIAIDMFEFLADRLVEERDKKPARAPRSEETKPDAIPRHKPGHASA